LQIIFEPQSRKEHKGQEIRVKLTYIKRMVTDHMVRLKGFRLKAESVEAESSKLKAESTEKFKA